MLSLLVVLLHLAAFNFHNAHSQPIQGSPERQNDVQLLLMLKYSITNWPAFAAANRISGWDPGVPVCLWTGVSCTDTGDIISVALQCRGACPVQAQGTLPQEIARLSHLETLNLEGQALRGPLPPSWFEADAWPGLRNLFLSGNPMGGTLPDTQPGALRDLSQLRLSNCGIEGPLPGSWGRDETSMRHLNVLRVDGNRLNGTLPEDWATAAAFPEIATLDLSSNNLTGPLPSLWGDPRAARFLQELFLGENNFTGGLPAGFGNPAALRELRYLDLSNNPIGGEIPPKWLQNGSFPALRSLDFNGSGLNGVIPSNFPAAFPVLDVLRIPNNNFSGPLPPTFQFFNALDRLVLKPGNPLLCGSLPPNLPFQVCDDRDVTCMRIPVELLPVCPPGLPSAPEAFVPAAAAPVAPAPPLTPASTPAPSVSAPPPSGGGSNTGAIVGGVVGGVVAAILAALLVALVLRRRRRQQRGRVTAVKADILPSVRPFFSEEDAAAGAGRGTALAPAPAGAAAVAAAPAGPFEGPDLEKGLENGIPAVAIARVSSVGMVSPFQQPLGAFTDGGRSEVPTPSMRSTPRRLASLLSSLRSFQASRSSTSTPPSGPFSAATLPPTLPESPDISVRGYGGDLLPPVRPSASFDDFPEDNEGGGPPSPAPSSPGAPPWDDWEVGLSELEVCLRPDDSEWVIGSGGFGRVYKAMRNGVQPVAVKVIPAPPPGAPTARDHTKHEIAILKACRDANIVQFQGAYMGPNETLLVTEYMDGGDLMNNLQKARVSWWRRGRRIAIDVAKALAYLHSRKIVHFDVKSSNVLLAKDGTAKLGDVGMARFLAADYVTGVVATLAWAAPEMLWGARCTEKADIYSYGIVLWEICTGEAPERGRLRDIRVPEEAPQEVRDLVLECLNSEPRERPSAHQIVERLQALPRVARTPGTAATAPPAVEMAVPSGSGSGGGSGEQRSSEEAVPGPEPE